MAGKLPAIRAVQWRLYTGLPVALRNGRECSLVMGAYIEIDSEFSAVPAVVSYLTNNPMATQLELCSSLRIPYWEQSGKPDLLEFTQLT